MQNPQRTFDILQREKLGNYVYALRDPRDRKIFYVGQGINDRVFDHFNEAENCFNLSRPFNTMSSKVVRILDIWKNEEDVEWFIVSHNLPDDNMVSNHVESAIFNCLLESQNGETLNNISPPDSTILLPDDIEAMAAEFVNPDIAYNNVFVFPIQNLLARGLSPYAATRSFWKVNENNRTLNSPYAVGLEKSISKGSFEIANWVNATAENKYEFISPGHPNPVDYEPLIMKNWNNVLANATGFWQRGNYLIVEFDGNGKFRIVRGSQDKTTWHNCI
jgi:hypothetical protein